MLSVTPPVIEISQQIQQLEIIVTSLLNSLPTYQHQMFHISDHLHLQSPTTIHIIINTKEKKEIKQEHTITINHLAA